MSVSLPSKEVVTVDIPEVKEFSGEFRYNYFVPDESVSEDPTSTPKSIVQRPSEQFDSSYVDNVATRIPRFVKFNFGPVYLSNATQEADDAENRSLTVNRKIASEGLIKKFYDKIISEDEFVSYQFTSINFSDQNIGDKLYQFVSGSLSTIFEDMKQDNQADADLISEEKRKREEAARRKKQQEDDEAAARAAAEEARRPKPTIDIGSYSAPYLQLKKNFSIPLAFSSYMQLITFGHITVNTSYQVQIPPAPPPPKLVEITSPLLQNEGIRYDFLFNSFVQPAKSGILFFEDPNNKVEKKAKPFDKLKNVSLHMQINSRLIDRIVKGSYKTPASTVSSDLLQLANISQDIRAHAVKRTSNSITNDEYKTVVDPIDVASSTTSTSSRSSKRLIGYVIDKWELTNDGQYLSKEPIFLENPYINSGIDFNVRYGATYVYQMRSIAEFTIPAVNDEDNLLFSVKLLISSKPTRKIAIKCHENVPPPHPTDLNAHWNYENNKLVLTWAFPINPQRDIKQFQVFRRSSINEPFQLIQQYNFDDSAVPFAFGEEVPNFLIKNTSQPALYHIDHDFKKNSKFIYCLASIDAHAMTSNYSEQFEITFDKYSNKLVKKIVSISGAPKQYPNLQLLKDTFVEAMYDETHTRMKVYFMPEYFSVYDEKERNVDVVMTNNHGAEYRIQIINLDMQKSTNVDIEIEDRRTSKYPKEETNPQRALTSVRPDRFKM